MKFVKANLVLVICGAVVLLALVSIWYPTLTWEQSFTADLAQHHHDQAASILTKTNKVLVLPGVPEINTTTAPATGPAKDVQLHGIPTPNLIKIREVANVLIKKAADEVIRLGGQANKNNRVIMVNGVGIPLLDGAPQRGYLPKIANVDPEEFKKAYNAQFDRWLTTLTGAKAGSPTYPPMIEDLNAEFAAMKAKIAAGMPAGLQPTADQPGSKEVNDWLRKQVMGRAGNLKMYVDQGVPYAEKVPAGMVNAFQRGDWANQAAPPNENEIFTALVESWFQSDVVKAIAAVNDTELMREKDSTKRNVGLSPVKRLMKISVGDPDASASRLTNAQGGAAGGLGGGPAASPGASNLSGLWYIPAAPAGGAAAASTDGPPQATGSAAANTIDFTRTLTGRASGSEYDVVRMQIWMDIDPSYLNKFIESLYRQNMGYTVLSIKYKTVDPLDRASNGFIYGETQVIETEILVEGLLFRSWTQPLMPKDVATFLGANPPAAPAGPPN